MDAAPVTAAGQSPPAGWSSGGGLGWQGLARFDVVARTVVVDVGGDVDAVSSGGFGGVEGGVGFAEQGGGVGGVLGEADDAEAGGDCSVDA